MEKEQFIREITELGLKNVTVIPLKKYYRIGDKSDEKPMPTNHYTNITNIDIVFSEGIAILTVCHQSFPEPVAAVYSGTFEKVYRRLKRLLDAKKEG